MSRLPPRTRLLALVVVVSTIVGAAAAKINTSGHIQVATATTHVMIDFPEPSIVYRRAFDQDLSTLRSRAELYGRMMVTRPVLRDIARRAGISPDEVSGIARTTGGVTVSLMQPDSEERAAQLRDASDPYRLEIQPDWQRPMLAIYSQGPTTDAARRLADASVLGLQDYLDARAKQAGFPRDELPQIRQLGNARGSVVNGRAVMVIGGFTFMVVFGLTATVLLSLTWLVRRDLLVGRDTDRRPPAPPRDDWPRTNRLLPWTLAGFITVLWLTPFDRIQLTFHTPIDMKLDRLLLPVVLVVAFLALAAGRAAAPRLRLTPIHIALGAFVAVAFLSVVVQARSLNQSLEFEVAVKKLPLLISYVSVFLIIAASVRPTEVRAFMTLTVWLGVICGFGVIWEYRFGVNLFTLFSDRLLPGFFELTLDTSGASLDSAGRRGVTGPAAVGLEAVAMLSFALAIVVVRLLSTREFRTRALYGLAACIILAATFATGRKSALFAPAAVLITLAYFRRRELLALAPIGLVICVAVAMLSPGAVRGTVSQLLAPDRTTVATTSDRISDYDAVRPDVWSHPLLGRGYGTYAHETYRLLDSEILMRVIETGLIGLLAFLGVGITVVLAGRRTIADRHPSWAPHALVGAACAASFLVMSTLFDLLGFPHVTYLFLYIAGLVAAVLARDRTEMTPERRRRLERAAEPRVPAAAASQHVAG